MNSYELKQAARRERLLTRADQLREAAQRLAHRASEQAATIPLGQPILIGHHSETADRNFRARIGRPSTRRRSWTAGACTAAACRRCRARRDFVRRSGRRPEAGDEVRVLTQRQGAMKAVNKALRSGDGEALRMLGVSQPRRRIEAPD